MEWIDELEGSLGTERVEPQLQKQVAQQAMELDYLQKMQWLLLTMARFCRLYRNSSRPRRFWAYIEFNLCCPRRNCLPLRRNWPAGIKASRRKYSSLRHKSSGFCTAIHLGRLHCKTQRQNCIFGKRFAGRTALPYSRHGLLPSIARNCRQHSRFFKLWKSNKHNRLNQRYDRRPLQKFKSGKRPLL